ncbi:hypothetical protein Hs30E_08260 [Lactococcus hodotermopsidis]|uniref:Uncharacterized protein n=1 Tax=Pseudolactococcus hodotermopsidis TaxID=2709157 RepID=A0A6A0BC79_9LACT|nr:hypothetical protein Hs30E_08260 [Lactococcus hodotermopsidis]
MLVKCLIDTIPSGEIVKIAFLSHFKDSLCEFIAHLTLDFLRETCEDKAVETMQPWGCELKTNDAHYTSHIRFFA